MNPMTNVKNIKKLSELELKRNLKTSWHDQYKGSAWIFVGGLPYDLTEGDIICVFSQYGEIVNINLIRDKATGKTKGFCFLCYEDQRSTVLAVDNFNGIKLLGRTLRVDHVQDYKPPKDSEKKTAETRQLLEEGCAPNVKVDLKKENVDDDDCMVVEQPTPVVDLVNEKCKVKSEQTPRKKKKEKRTSKVKVKKEKESDKKKKKKVQRKTVSSSSSDGSSSSDSSSESSSEDSGGSSSDSDDEVQSKKRKHKKNKKAKRHGIESAKRKSNSTTTRQKLEERIKALEKALNSVRSGRNKQEKSKD